MTVTSPDLPSRAGSLDLIADDLALNFANTESGRGFPSHQNHFREAANVVEWLRHAKALPADEADWLQTHMAKRADLAADLLAQAVGLREAIHDIGVALGHRAKPPEAALASLSALHARCVAKAELAPGVCVVPLDMERARFAGRGGAGSDRARGGPAVHGGRFSPHQGMRRSRLRLVVL